jgi:hypothetical protein
MPFRGHILFAALIASGALRCVEAASVRVFVDVSATPNAQPFVGPVKTLFEEWYPKINDALFGKGATPPFKEVRVIFEPKVELDMGTGKEEWVAAYTQGNIVHVNFAVLGVMTDDYRAMLIHELVHVSQNYGGVTTANRWLVEGIADYVRHKYFERDLVPKLEWDSDGTLKGLGAGTFAGKGMDADSDLERAKLEKQGYLSGYTIAAPFLYWLEIHKDQKIVMTLTQDIRESRYSADVFQQRCGASVDQLWQEFLLQK